MVERSGIMSTTRAHRVGGDPHPAWHAQFHQLFRAFEASSHHADKRKVGLCDEILRLEKLIASTPAATLAGVAVQLRLIQENDQRADTDMAALSNALATVERLAKEAQA